MPRQGQSVESCIITDIYVKVGDEVKKGDILFAYETDKASFEEEAQETGELLAFFYSEGDEVPVLSNVGVLGKKGESVDEFAPGGSTNDEEEKVSETNAELVIEDKEKEQVKTLPVQTAVEGTSQFVSPRAKNLAEKEGVDYNIVPGSGPGGRVIERDIVAAMANQPKVTPLAKEVMKEEGLAASSTGSGLAGKVTAGDLVSKNPVYAEDSEIVPMSNIRKLIAKAMHNSLQNSAQLTHHLGADARRMLELRDKVKQAQKEGYEHNITLNDMICFAVIKALKAFPRVNSHFLGDSMRMFKKVHLGLAVDTERGLMVPTIKNADDLTIQGLSSQMKQLAEACRKGSIDPELLASEGASFTVSNLGNYGVEIFTPVINLPQVAILGVNTVVPRPKDLGNGAYGFVPYLGLSLTYDHQALDGGEATRFVKTIATEIENLEFTL